MTKANTVRRLITLSFLALLATSAIVLLHRVKPRTAPSLKIDLISCANISAKAATSSPLSSPPIQKDAEFKVFNRGDRPVRIEKGIIIEQRPVGMSDLDFNVNHLFQTNLFGATGTIEPGGSRTFIVRFWSMGGAHVGGGGLIQNELRGVCETSPAELSLRLMSWLKGQAWSKYLPRGLFKEVNSYIFSSAWTSNLGTGSVSADSGLSNDSR